MTKWIKKFAASAAIAASLASGAVMASAGQCRPCLQSRTAVCAPPWNHEPSISHLGNWLSWRTTPASTAEPSALPCCTAQGKIRPQHRDLVNVWVGEGLADVYESRSRITGVHMDGHDDDEREVQACVEDSADRFGGLAIENALSGELPRRRRQRGRSTMRCSGHPKGIRHHAVHPLSAGPPPVYSDRVYDYPADSAAPPTVADPGGHNRGLCRGDRPGDCGWWRWSLS